MKVFVCAVLLALALPATLAQLQYVPKGCQGLNVAVSASVSGSFFDGYSIGGTVTLSNPNEFAMPIQQIKVVLTNNQGYPPLTATANCPYQSVPTNPQPYALGYLRCSYSIDLPSNGGATSRAGAWSGAQATAAIKLSGATCSSGVTNIQQRTPPFNGGGTCPSPITLTVSQSSDETQIQGTVEFQNGGWSNIYLSGAPTYSVTVGEYEDGEPVTGAVSCPSLTVPWTWRPGGYGSLTCTFTATPDNAVAYSSAIVTASLSSGRTCPSGDVQVQQLLAGGGGSGSSGSGSSESGGEYSSDSNSSGNSNSGSGDSGSEYSGSNDSSTTSEDSSSGSGSPPSSPALLGSGRRLLVKYA